MIRYYVYVSGEEGVYVTARDEQEAVELATENGFAHNPNTEEVFAVPAEGENEE